jgi:hypothetical protein
MSGLAWVALVIGLVIVILAVGIPYFLTHRRMREPLDVSDSHDYLRDRRRWIWQRRVAGASWRGTTGRTENPDQRPPAADRPADLP